jgi:hypothetical protein
MNIACQPAIAADNKGKCDPDRIQSEIEKAEAKFDDKELRRKAEATGEFKDKIKGHQVEFNSVYSTWSFDPATCEGLTLKDVNVVHSLRAEGEKESTTNLISHFDPNMKNVARVSKQVAKKSYATTYALTSTNYAGYEVRRSTSWSGTKASWNVPNIVPNGKIASLSSWQVQCMTTCSLATWVGLQDSRSSKLIQGGSASDYTCGIVYNADGTSYGECTRQQTLFYQFYPSASVDCTNTGTTDAGDEIYASVSTEYLGSSVEGSQYKYSITVNNKTKGKACSGNATYAGLTTSKAFFIGERPSGQGYYQGQLRSFLHALPKFPELQISQPSLKDGSTYKNLLQTQNTVGGVSFYMRTMQNSGTTNVEPSVLGENGTFTLKWLSSENAGVQALN